MPSCFFFIEKERLLANKMFLHNSNEIIIVIYVIEILKYFGRENRLCNYQNGMLL